MKSKVIHYRKNAAGDLIFVGIEYVTVAARPSARRATWTSRAQNQRELQVANLIRDDFESLVDAACESAAD